jgi:ABC-type multidrug transport system ATPase subunit/pSer/pThr/pTyr-binding forkhead associated (FHA) protein
VLICQSQVVQIYIKSEAFEQRMDLSPGVCLELGRAIAPQHGISIPDAHLSRRHLLIEYDGREVWVTDLNSRNGSFLNRQRLEPNRKVAWQPEQQLVLTSKTSLQFQYVVAPAQDSGTKNKATKSGANGLLDLLQQRQEIVIGRSPECDIVLPDQAVSRKHARIYRSDSSYFLEDLGSTNGTFVNQKRIKGRHELRPSDVVFIGLHAFSLQQATRNLKLEPALQAVNVFKIYKNGYTALHNIRLSLGHGELVALMGPSGCGKSTLLKALNGDEPASGGSIYLFGLELNQHYNLLKQNIGYVPQDDIVHPELTVDQTLFYAARLRLADQASEESIRERITEVLEALKISDSVIRGTRVQRLSGGQRKRVSIAVELLSRPSILFLDEPTSPLDPETVGDFMRCLRDLCSRGTTVVMVTHKPEDLGSADRLVFIGANGYLVYDGPHEEVASYFGTQNLIEVYALMSEKNRAADYYRRWNRGRNSDEPSISLMERREQNSGVFRQLKWLLLRYAHVKISNVTNVVLMMLQPLLIAVLIMLVFSQMVEPVKGVNGKETLVGNTGMLFMMTIAAIWFGMSNSAREIVGERAIFRREMRYNMIQFNYVLSKWLVLGGILLIQLLLFVGLLKWNYGSEMKDFPATLGYLWLVSSSAVLFGLVLSAWSNNTEEVMTVLPVAMMPQILLAGIVAPINNITTYLSGFTFGRWGTEGLGRIQDADRAGTFMNPLKTQLNYEHTAKFFDRFQVNVGMLLLLDLLLLLLLFIGLNRILNQRQ